MRRVWPTTSLHVRIGAIVALQMGLMLILARLLLGNPDDVGHRLYRLPAAKDVAVAAEILEQATPAMRPTLLRALSTADQRASLLPGADERPDTSEPLPDAPALGDLSAYAAALGSRPFEIQIQDEPRRLAFARELLSRTPIRVLVTLRSGEVLAMELTAPASVSRAASRSGLLLAAICALNLLVTLVLAVQTTGPVRRLVREIQADADDLNAKPLKVRGARELRELAAAFNAVRARLGSVMAARTRMLAAVAHDFRTYLTRLELRADYIQDPRQRALAQADIDEMTTLLNDTLTFAEQTAGPRETRSEAIDVVREIKIAIALRTDGGGEARFVAPDGPVAPARINRVAFQRILANLIDNGERYGQHVTVRVASEPDGVEVLVEDEGPGVPEAQLETLIEPFQRLEDSRARHTGGAGLGLAIVHALAVRHGGGLILENRSEGGFRARLRLSRG